MQRRWLRRWGRRVQGGTRGLIWLLWLPLAAATFRFLPYGTLNRSQYSMDHNTSFLAPLQINSHALHMWLCYLIYVCLPTLHQIIFMAEVAINRALALNGCTDVNTVLWNLEAAKFWSATISCWYGYERNNHISKEMWVSAKCSNRDRQAARRRWLQSCT